MLELSAANTYVYNMQYWSLAGAYQMDLHLNRIYRIMTFVSSSGYALYSMTFDIII